MKFQQALGEAISRDVLFMHVDCGAFTPYRWNPASLKVEYWSPRDGKWAEVVGGYEADSKCEDWDVTNRPRANYEKIVYKD